MRTQKHSRAGGACCLRAVGKKNGIFSLALLLFLTGTAIIFLKAPQTLEIQTHATVTSARPQLVIDPGHGGLDGGASAADGMTESTINLSLSLRMYDLALLLGERPVMTRVTEDLQYPESATTIREKKVWDQKQRVERINKTENAVLISVHQNFYPDARPNGAVVLYGAADGSSALAERVQSQLTTQLCPENRRVAAPASQNIYLMKQVSCPSILVECGFLSNPAEAELLNSADYQKKLALILITSYFQHTEENIGGF